MNCVIVDDEQLAQDVLENYISKTPVLSLVGKFDNAFDLFKFLHANSRVDLIFLDIKMPEMSGLELVASLKKTPHIIFTTAYHDHALDAFNLDAVDYLLKPISYERFMQSISKAMSLNPKATSFKSDKTDKIFIQSDKKLIGFKVSDILYIESQRNYFVIVTKDKNKTTIHNTLSYLEDALKDYENLVRVHRSYFVNLTEVKEIANNVAVIDAKTTVPIGQMYRDQVKDKLKII